MSMGGIPALFHFFPPRNKYIYTLSHNSWGGVTIDTHFGALMRRDFIIGRSGAEKAYFFTRQGAGAGAYIIWRIENEN